MKAHRLLWAGAVIAALVVPGAFADQAAFSAKAKELNGLIGYWDFEGNYEDRSGKGSHGRAEGDTSLIKACPGVKGGQGVEFDNETDTGQFITVRAPVGGPLDSPTLSVFVWAKIDSEPIHDRWDNIIDRTSLWYIETQWKELEDGSFGIDYVARIYDPENIQSGGTGQVRTSANNTYYKRGEWHLYGFTYDGQNFVSYVDGVEVRRVEYTRGVGPNALTPSEDESRHGHYDINWGAFTQNDDYMNGCVDDTVIYNRALSAAEVKALYDAMMQ